MFMWSVGPREISYIHELLVITPYMQPSHPSLRTVDNSGIIPLEGVVTMVHMKPTLLQISASAVSGLRRRHQSKGSASDP